MKFVFFERHYEKGAEVHHSVTIFTVRTCLPKSCGQKKLLALKKKKTKFGFGEMAEG